MEATMNHPRKKHFKMPGAFTILFILTVVSVALTWFVPAGSYAKLSYQPASRRLEVVQPSGKKETLPATQKELEKLGVKIDIKQFTSGALNKPVSIPNTYKRQKQRPAKLSAITNSMVDGTINAVDIMVFILVLGGLIGVVKESGAFEAGLGALTKKTKGKEFLLVFLVTVLMGLGGTLCGIEEEAIAFYPILVPIFIAMGYDSIICVGAIFLASSIGTTFSTINPFSAVIASNAAGINFTQGLTWRAIGCVIGLLFVLCYLYWYAKKVKANPSFSYSYDDHESFDNEWSVKSDDGVGTSFTWKKKVILLLFVVAFPIMIWGVMSQGWWFNQMASAFLMIAIIIMFLVCLGRDGIGEKKTIDAFVNGASSLVGVSLIIGLARGINLILTNGLISDTILEVASSLVKGMNGPLFIIMMVFVFFILGFIVPSSSGLAVLAMPIMAPLADSVNIPRFTVVMAYQFGQYAMLFLAPTGLVMATLQMLDMKYAHWVRFVWPVVLFVLVFGSALIITAMYIGG